MCLQPHGSQRRIPTLSEIRSVTQQKFGKRACHWQLKICEELLKGEKDVTCIAGTGSGKTMTFWMPLLFRDGIQVIVTPLNILGEQNVADLARLGIKAIELNAKTATSAAYRLIEEGYYRAIIVNPEELMKEGGEFDKLLHNEGFTSRIISVVWDEAHCVATWGDFRPEYKAVRRLRYIIPRSIPFLVTSATLPKHILKEVHEILQIRSDRHHLVHRSNDRPTIAISVRKIKYALNSFDDLAFLVSDKSSDAPQERPPKFCIFFDSISTSIKAARYLKRRVQPAFRSKIKWFNSDMTDAYKRTTLQQFKDGEIWGLCCTDSFGMGVDLPDIELVIQWRVTCNLSTLWQRFGRGARGHGRIAVAVLFAEASFFFDVQEEAARKREQRAEKRKRKGIAAAVGSESARKKQRVGTDSAGNPLSAPAPLVQRPPEDNHDEDGDRSEAEDKGENDEAHGDEGANPRPNMAASSIQSQADSDELNQKRIFEYDAESSSMILKTSKLNIKEKRKELEAAMDDFINPVTPRAQFSCLRQPVDAFFGNSHTRSDHGLCMEGGCTRCGPPTREPAGHACCSLCSPDHPDFQRFNVELPTASKIVKRKRVVAKYERSRTEMELADALNVYRRAAIERKYGRQQARRFGVGRFMPDDMLERIVDAAHAHLIQTTKDLHERTHWTHAGSDGDDVVAIVLKFIPLPPPPPSAQPSTGADSLDAPPASGPKCTVCHTSGHNARTCPSRPNGNDPLLPHTPARAQIQGGRGLGASGSTRRSTPTTARCGSCGQIGHISSNRKCPQHPSKRHTAASPKGNISPAANMFIFETPSASRATSTRAAPVSPTLRRMEPPSPLRNLNSDGSIPATRFYD
ncbi:P-loop containing nucleoside triphosphate hydrolase protein [Peniophora sp. CONT]|nr:P-loop containing nucleoside triphosphate hydrolase protein [Peniophora sp. CONT]